MMNENFNIQTLPQSLSVAEIVADAVSACERPSGARRSQGSLHLLSSKNPTEPFEVKLEPGQSTAFWRPHLKGAQRIHQIGVGDSFYKQCVVRIRGNPKKLGTFCRALIRHEVAHALFTEPELEKVFELCASVGVPFRLLNLLEDARVDHLERERARKTARDGSWRFHWWCFVNTPQETNNPGCYLWSLVNKEASSWSRYSAGAPRWSGKPGMDARIRDSYYHRAIYSARTSDLIPLCQEWMAEFPRPSAKVL